MNFGTPHKNCLFGSGHQFLKVSEVGGGPKKLVSGIGTPSSGGHQRWGHWLEVGVQNLDTKFWWSRMFGTPLLNCCPGFAHRFKEDYEVGSAPK